METMCNLFLFFVTEEEETEIDRNNNNNFKMNKCHGNSAPKNEDNLLR